MTLMARPLRIEFPNALYHITSRGNRREDIYLDDNDRAVFLDLLLQVRERFNWVFHSYCLMSNHYHLLQAWMWLFPILLDRILYCMSLLCIDTLQ
jgi:REP element-mobilizing transposase RayT